MILTDALIYLYRPYLNKFGNEIIIAGYSYKIQYVDTSHGFLPNIRLPTRLSDHHVILPDTSLSKFKIFFFLNIQHAF